MSTTGCDRVLACHHAARLGFMGFYDSHCDCARCITRAFMHDDFLSLVGVIYIGSALVQKDIGKSCGIHRIAHMRSLTLSVLIFNMAGLEGGHHPQ